ncbi:MAG: FtsX-like permease family protein [Saprospiraceae bacterium]|nr:FtsX-like permease family protein [Saprospiraceae bacterium]MCB9325093.1 FtsX-like permease family protein [Lewinellaceae bacterium]
MIQFLIKGLFRDRSRSTMPILVVAIGVMLCVLMHAYVTGVMGDTIEMNARFATGHVKVMSKAYAENVDQIPNDLALMDVGALLEDLKTHYPDMDWAPRIKFGGLIDAPDENGETKAQGPAMGLGFDLLSKDSKEDERLNLSASIVRGSMPVAPGEVLLSETFSEKLKVNPGDMVTLIGSSMNGSMIMYNFKVAGTILFGSNALDRGTIIADIEDVRQALDMYDAAGEITGFFSSGYFEEEKAVEMVQQFNANHIDEANEYAPIMLSLRDQHGMATLVNLSKTMGLIVTLVFMMAMSLVLWNAGLLGGLRRYGEVGLRLAIGEEKRHVYFSMILESIFIGIAGSVLGTAIGLFFAWLLQTYGIDISSMMKGASVMMPSRIRAHIMPVDFYIGFIPGVISTVIGTALSGIGIYKRNTAQLFKELEV